MTCGDSCYHGRHPLSQCLRKFADDGARFSFLWPRLCLFEVSSDLRSWHCCLTSCFCCHLPHHPGLHHDLTAVDIQVGRMPAFPSFVSAAGLPSDILVFPPKPLRCWSRRVRGSNCIGSSTSSSSFSSAVLIGTPERLSPLLVDMARNAMR